MNIKTENINCVLGKLITGTYANVDTNIYNEETGRVCGKFYLVYDTEGNAYMITLRNKILEVISINNWKTILEVNKKSSTYSFPITRVEVSLSTLIAVFKYVETELNNTENADNHFIDYTPL